jgi:hypothetical protein
MLARFCALTLVVLSVLPFTEPFSVMSLGNGRPVGPTDVIVVITGQSTAVGQEDAALASRWRATLERQNVLAAAPPVDFVRVSRTDRPDFWRTAPHSVTPIPPSILRV